MTVRAEAAREAIIDAAVAVFGRFGYRKTSMDSLAQAAGVSRPAVYQYFPNKAAVFCAVAEHVGTQLHAAAEAASGRPGTTADRLYAVLAVKLDFTASTVEADFRRELVQEAAEVAAEVVAASEARYADLVASALAEADDLDLLGTAIPVGDAAALLTDAMLGIARSTAGADLMHVRLRQLVELAVRGLATRT